MEKQKVSIIIPIYNTEPYLSECIDSVRRQTYHNLEIILVDDGSTDSSPQLCDRYAKMDRRIRVIHQSNQGVSAARNAGLAVMHGAYVAFLDSDDKIACDMIAVLADNLRKTGAELSVCGISQELSRDKGEYPDKVEVLTMHEAIRQVILNPMFNGYVANKMFLSAYLKAYRLAFEPEVAMFEDQLLVVQYIRHCRKICVTDRVLYFYRKNPESISRKAFDYKRITAIYAQEKILHMLREDGLADEYLCKSLWNGLMRAYVYWYKDLLFLPADGKTEWLQYIRKQFMDHRGLYSYDEQWTWKGRLCRSLWSVLFRF